MCRRHRAAARVRRRARRSARREQARARRTASRDTAAAGTGRRYEKRLPQQRKRGDFRTDAAVAEQYDAHPQIASDERRARAAGCSVSTPRTGRSDPARSATARGRDEPGSSMAKRSHAARGTCSAAASAECRGRSHARATRRHRVGGCGLGGRGEPHDETRVGRNRRLGVEAMPDRHLVAAVEQAAKPAASAKLCASPWRARLSQSRARTAARSRRRSDNAAAIEAMNERRLDRIVGQRIDLSERRDRLVRFGHRQASNAGASRRPGMTHRDTARRRARSSA